MRFRIETPDENLARLESWQPVFLYWPRRVGRYLVWWEWVERLHVRVCEEGLCSWKKCHRDTVP